MEEEPFGVEPVVITCSLGGIVFDNDAVWNTQVSNQHTDYDKYDFLGTSNPNNGLLGSVDQLTTGRTVVAWESVYDGDASASSDYCTGMIGWGVYGFTLQVQGSMVEPTVQFTLNTLDGRWMYQRGADHPTNKFIFRMTREGTDGISLEVFNWVSGDFMPVDFNSTVSFWSNNVEGSRFRDGLSPLTVMPFTLSLSTDYPLGCDEAVIDVHLGCDASLNIATGKKISIVDYYDEYTQEYESTIVRFALGTGIELGFNNIQYLTTALFVQGHHSNDQKTVILASTSYDGGEDYRYSLWNGIKAFREKLQYSSSAIFLKNCAILNAIFGLEVNRSVADNQFHSLEIDSCMIRHCGKRGVETLNSNINLHNTEIDDCLFGIWYKGYSFNHNHPNRIYNCWIQDMERIGIVIESHAKGIDGSMARANILTIQENILQACRFHGISTLKSLAMLRGNYINSIGWTNASETPPKGYSGVWANECTLSFHENWVHNCSAYGLLADNCSYIQGNYCDYNTEDGGYVSIGDSNPLLWGLNCFRENDFHVGASNNFTEDSTWDPTTIVLGQRPDIYDPLGLSYIGHGNSFKYPLQSDNGNHPRYHLTAEQESEIWAFR